MTLIFFLLRNRTSISKATVMQKKKIINHKKLSDELTEVLKCFRKDTHTTELVTGPYIWNYEESNKNFRYVFFVK